jgi:hypothetical protein
MSNCFQLVCSCGSDDDAEQPSDAMNHAEDDLFAMLNARAAIISLHAHGIEFSIDVCGWPAKIPSGWFIRHTGDGHVLRLVDEFHCTWASTLENDPSVDAKSLAILVKRSRA